MFHFMSLALAPETFITQLLVGPVPRTIDCGLDATDVAGAEGRGAGCEVVGDVSTEAAVGVWARQAAS